MVEEEKPKAEKKEIKQAKIIDIEQVVGQAYELEDGTIINNDAELLIKIYNKLLRIEKSVA